MTGALDMYTNIAGTTGRSWYRGDVMSEGCEGGGGGASFVTSRGKGELFVGVYCRIQGGGRIVSGRRW